MGEESFEFAPNKNYLCYQFSFSAVLQSDQSNLSSGNFIEQVLMVLRLSEKGTLCIESSIANRTRFREVAFSKESIDPPSVLMASLTLLDLDSNLHGKLISKVFCFVCLSHKYILVRKKELLPPAADMSDSVRARSKQ